MSKQEFEWPNIDWWGVVKKHQANARKYMQENGIDLLLINEPDTIHSLIGMSTMKFYDGYQAIRFLVDQNFNGVFFSPFSGEPEIPFQYPGIEGIEKSLSVGSNAFYPSLQVEVLVREIAERKAKRVGVDRVFADIHFEVQRRLPDVEFVPVLWDLRKLREIKFPEEIEEMEVCAKICARGHKIAMEEAYVGITDGQLSGIFAEYVCAQNAMFPHNLYNLLGPTFEHWGIFGQKLDDGDNIVIDYGLYSKHGYIADMGRTMWVGNADPKFVDHTVRHAEATLDVGHNVLKPGMNKVEIAEAYKSAFRKADLSDHLHMLGHSCGFRVNEYPALDDSPVGMKWGEDAILKEGMVLCLEPMIISENRGDKFAMIQHEDMWVVEANSLRLLSTGGGYMGKNVK